MIESLDVMQAFLPVVTQNPRESCAKMSLFQVADRGAHRDKSGDVPGKRQLARKYLASTVRTFRTTNCEYIWSNYEFPNFDRRFGRAMKSNNDATNQSGRSQEIAVRSASADGNVCAADQFEERALVLKFY